MNYTRVFANGHSYFLTLVTYRRQPFLTTHIDLLREAFRQSSAHYRYRIDAIVILPDHLHMIITPENASEYPKIIHYIKRHFVYGLPNTVKQTAKLLLTPSQYRRRHSGIWQSRYYEHTIRNEQDLHEKTVYIRNNPIKHGICDAWDKWKYSSFTRRSYSPEYDNNHECQNKPLHNTNTHRPEQPMSY